MYHESMYIKSEMNVCTIIDWIRAQVGYHWPQNSTLDGVAA